MTTLKRLVGVLALVTVVPFAILLVLEGLASIGLLAHDAAAAPPPAAYPQVVHDTLLGWIGRPNVARPDHFGPHLSLTHDATGMRVHRPVTGAPTPGERGIVCSGGSLVYGAGVADSQTACAELERELPGVRTINMAHEGFGIDQAYLWYMRDGRARPHRLHLFAFTRGDFDRMERSADRGYRRPALTVKDGKPVAANVPIPDRPASRWSDLPALLEDSRLAHAIERRTGWEESRRARAADDVWRVAQAVFTDLDRSNRAEGSRLVVVYLPTLADLRPGPNDRRRDALAAFGRRSGIPFVDLTAEMRAVSPDSADWLFITPNALPVPGVAGRYSAAGHRWIAAHLAERLRAMPELSRAVAAAP